MLPSAKPGSKVLCVDDSGLELGLIKVGETYEIEGFFITHKTGNQKYKGFPAISEIAIKLVGIERIKKPNGRNEGGQFSIRRFMAI